MSSNLWVSHRNFPAVPVFEGTFEIPYFVDQVLYYGLLILLVCVTFLKNRMYVIGLLTYLIVLMLFDQMRWQPWVYTYILVLLPFSVKSEKNSAFNIRSYLQILFIGIYFWSGIHKFNPNFSEYIVESFARQLFNVSNFETLASIKKVGYLFPVIEILTALFLLIPRTRKLGLVAIVLTHLFIIIYVSPIGMNYNYIILPWNIFMILVSFLLFYHSKKSLVFLKGDFKEQLLTLFILVLMLLPTLNFFNAWDSYLSFSLYSGKVDNYYILSKDDFSGQTDYTLTDYIGTKTENQQGEILHLNFWASSVLNVPMYPEKRVFKKVAASFCAEEHTSSNFIFLTTNLPLWKLHKSKEGRPQENTETYTNQILFFNFDKGIKKGSFDYFICDDLKRE